MALDHSVSKVSPWQKAVEIAGDVGNFVMGIPGVIADGISFTFNYGRYGWNRLLGNNLAAANVYNKYLKGDGTDGSLDLHHVYLIDQHLTSEYGNDPDSFDNITPAERNEITKMLQHIQNVDNLKDIPAVKRFMQLNNLSASNKVSSVPTQLTSSQASLLEGDVLTAYKKVQSVQGGMNSWNDYSAKVANSSVTLANIFADDVVHVPEEFPKVFDEHLHAVKKIDLTAYNKLVANASLIKDELRDKGVSITSN